MNYENFTEAEAEMYRRADMARANNGSMGEWTETEADNPLRDWAAWAVVAVVCVIAAWMLVGWLMDV